LSPSRRGSLVSTTLEGGLEIFICALKKIGPPQIVEALELSKLSGELSEQLSQLTQPGMGVSLALDIRIERLRSRRMGEEKQRSRWVSTTCVM